jgi:GTP-binding nuclear protein Ran
MVVCQLDDDDLDEEDRAILAEVAKKGYYHGRPKNQAGPPPAKIDAPAPQKLEADGVGRAAFDDFQRKWDRFDDDSYLRSLENTAAAATEKVTQRAPAAEVRPLAEFKVLLVGDPGVGKSALLRRHLTGEFQRKWVKTATEEVHKLRFDTNCGCLTFNMWVVASGSATQGRERFYTQGHAAIVMFDLTSKSSYRNVPAWHRELERLLGVIPTVLLGNKADAENRQVAADQIRFHKGKNMQYYDLSVQEQHNIERPFLWLAQKLSNQARLQFVGPIAKAPPRATVEKLEGIALQQIKEQQEQASSVAIEPCER